MIDEKDSPLLPIALAMTGLFEHVCLVPMHLKSQSVSDA